MGPVSVGDSLLQKRCGNDPKAFAMTLSLDGDQEASGVRPKDAHCGPNNSGEAAELSVFSSNTSPGIGTSTGTCARERSVSTDVDSPPIAISQPIPVPQKPIDEMEPPSTPKRKVSFAPNASSLEEAMNQESDQSALSATLSPPRTPPHYSAQCTPHDGSSFVAENVDRILRVRIRGPLIVMLALLLFVVLLLVAISGMMLYVLMGMRNAMDRKNLTAEIPYLRISP